MLLSRIFLVFISFFGTVGYSQCSELFFSEYLEGSSSNKAFEIYNPTDVTVDLTDYVVYRNNNGSLTPSDSLHPEGFLAPFDVFVVGNPGASLSLIMTESDTLHTMTFFNGDDALWLKNKVTGDTIDIIGQIGVDPGSGWWVGSGATNNNTLIRMITVQQGQTDWTLGSTEWDVFPIDMDDSLGTHSMFQCYCSFDLVENACDSLLSPDGTEYWTTSGLYTDTVFTSSVFVCDSIFNVELSINSNTSSITSSSCFSFTVPSGDETYTSSGIYQDTLTNSLGCDSVMTIDLTINSIDNSVTQDGIELTANLSGVDYQWVDCGDSFSVISGETAQTFVPAEDGSYAVIVSDGTCADTSDCFDLVVGGLDSNESPSIQVFPNPFDSHFQVDLGLNYEDVNVTVRTLSGKQVFRQDFQGVSDFELLLLQDSGCYIIEVECDDLQSVFFKLFKL